MVYDKLPIDISRLKSYFPELKKIYDSNIPVNGEQLVYNAEIALDIKEEERKEFEQRYLLLMDKFGIINESYIYTDIFYITQKIIHELELLNSLISLDSQTLNALDFLIEYQELVLEVDAKRTSGDSRYQSDKEDAIIIQVKDRHSNGGIPLIYDGAGRLIMKMVYKAFKTTFHNTSLSHILEEHDEIPSLATLKRLRMPRISRDVTLSKEMLSATADILTSYFKSYLPKGSLSRKKNLFIYELFYLFNTLKYAGKVKDIDCSKLKRTNLNIVYSLPLEANKHSSLITELIKNSNRRDKPLSGAFLSFN
ncbi:MAG: hypothetical protein V4546_08975 [Bacteroidota bacterium]